MTNLIPGDGPTSDDAALDATDPGTLADIADVDPGDQPVPTQPYVFDAADVEPAARVLDAVFATLRSGWEGWGAVETAVTELDVTPPDSCRRALGEIAARPLRMEPKGTPGAELDTSAGFGFDAASSASTDELALWCALIDTVSAPAAIARLGSCCSLGERPVQVTTPIAPRRLTSTPWPRAISNITPPSTCCEDGPWRAS
ncbi:hypothetical protein [Nocardia asiatica]